MNALLAVLILALAVGAASADNFSSVRDDPKTDEIVARMIYRGTNSHHRFSLVYFTIYIPAAPTDPH